MSELIEDARRERDIVYKRGRLTLIAAPLWWTVAVKLKWNGVQGIEHVARVLVSSKFFGFEDDGDSESIGGEDASERQKRQIGARASHLEALLDSQCPRMRPVGQLEIEVRRKNITEAVVQALRTLTRPLPPASTSFATDPSSNRNLETGL